MTSTIVIIALGVGNLTLSMVAVWQRHQQVRYTQHKMAKLRKKAAKKAALA